MAADKYPMNARPVFQARELLGIQSPYEMDGCFKTHGVFLDGASLHVV